VITSNNLGGSARVIGIQESPASARADLVCSNFRYRNPNYVVLYGTEPQGPRYLVYSGSGTADLVKYNDGRWIVKRVTWETGFKETWLNVDVVLE
jgi:hypothetical protein